MKLNVPETRSAPRIAPATGARILIVDDDPIVADSLAEFLRADGHRVSTAASGREALLVLHDARQGTSAASADADDTQAPPGEPGDGFQIAIVDVSMPGMSGMELLEAVARDHPATVVLMLTGYGSIDAAVRALRAGAFDYLAKPVVDAELRLALERALRQQALAAENLRLRSRIDQRLGLEQIVGGDYRMQKAFELIEAVAPSKATVLMTGESGTGKSLLARSIHQRSPRRAKPFIEIHCGSIPETLLESELFGHVKGAFTGANADKQGRFLAAHEGTIFIDEINSASPAMQLKLLRVLQERCFEPVGSTQTVEVDVRVILATNQSLEELVREGAFRQDLYYRINVVKIELPPLRDRPADVPALVRRFIAKHSLEHGRTISGLAPEALEALRRYRYPGNVRELENLIERAVVLARRPTIALEDFPPYLADDSGGPMMDPAARAGLMADDAVDAPDTPWVPVALDKALEEPERRILLKALRANNWNRQATADQLAINRTTLYKKIKQYGLDRQAG